MPRKSTKASTSRTRTKRPLAPTTRHHIPSSWRIVTARLLRASAEEAHASPRREVQIRLSGLWLERAGFPKGKRYLMSADLDFETIYLQADPTEKRRRR